jgi:class 3 adenylate cyclase/pimeloyl-ACP methyl ester carboxylesterase
VHGDSGDIAYQTFGQGPVDLLVVKSLLIPVDLMWEEPALARFLQGLGSFTRSVWFDQRGVGASDAIAEFDGRLTESIADDMVSLVDALGLERVAVLSVNPLPSVAALRFAATYPDRVDRLIILEPTVRLRRAEDYPVGLPDDIVDALLASSRRDHAKGDALWHLAPSTRASERYQRWAGLCARLSTTPGDAQWRVRASVDLDGRALLPSVSAPTFAVWYENSPLADQHAWVVEQLPNAESLVLPRREDRLFFLGDVDSLLNGIERFLTGSAHVRDAERALLTVMFVDIVRSTEVVAAMGDRRWRELLTTFEALWRSRVDFFRGVEVKTMGDGFVATFDGPGRALRSAHAINADVQDLGIRVRVGIHAGEIELRGSDIGGIAVHIAQRIQALAEPSEVLVSSTVKDLVAGSEIRFTERGRHPLQGVPNEWSLYRSHL